MKAESEMGAIERHRAMNRPQHPVCTICIANYNGVALLEDCLDSVLSQQGDASIEIIVHDDASTDDSVTLLRTKYPEVEVLASLENVGFCIGNNRMVAHARGEFVLLLNNDAALHSDALLTLLEAARAQSPAGILTLPQYDWETNELVDRGCLLDLFYNPVPNLDSTRKDVAMAIGACMFLARNVWDELGGFPDWMESIGEDMYLCCAARLHGYEVVALRGSGFRHRLGASFGGARISGKKLNTTLRRRRLSERNKTFVLFLCTPTPAMWLLLAIHLASLLLEGLVVAAIRLDRDIFLHVYANVPRSLIRESSRLLLLRKNIQIARRVSIRSYFRPFIKLPYKLIMLFRFGIPQVSR
jgi:GT2 family glycosyltransferase